MGSQTTYMKGRKDGGEEGREWQGREGEREKENKQTSWGVCTCSPHSKKDLRQQAEE